MRLTTLQTEIIAYCRDYLARNDQLPPTRQLQERFGWKSQTSAVQKMNALVKRRVLEYNENNKLRFRRPT